MSEMKDSNASGTEVWHLGAYSSSSRGQSNEDTNLNDQLSYQ